MSSPADPETPAAPPTWASPAGGPAAAGAAAAGRPAYLAAPPPTIAAAGPPASGGAPRGGGGLAITALVLGGLAVLLSVIPFACFAAFIPALGGIVFGIVALAKGSPRAALAIAGLGAATLALILATVMSFVTFHLISSIAQDVERNGGWEQLLEDPETAPYVEPDIEPWILPEGQDFRGTGADRIGVVPVDGVGSYGVARITAQGTGTFIVIARDVRGEEIERLVDLQAPYDGVVLWNTVVDVEVVEFEIVADDDWSVTLDSIDIVPEITEGGSLRGTGDAVYYYSGADTGATLTPDPDVEALLWSTSSAEPWLCDSAPGETCSTEIPGDGGALVQIYADGGWRIELGEPPVDATTT